MTQALPFQPGPESPSILQVEGSRLGCDVSDDTGSKFGSRDREGMAE